MASPPKRLTTEKLSTTRTAPSLAEWPQHRREVLLWRMALELDYDGVDDLVRHAGDEQCAWRWIRQHHSEPVAVQGDDGRYHLLRDGQVLCAGHGLSDEPPAPVAGTNNHDTVPHTRFYWWWTDGDTYRLYAPDTASANEQAAPPRHEQWVSWRARLGKQTRDPATVPPHQRCVYIGSRSDWPAFINPTTPTGRLRQQLVELAGNWCHACRLRTGVIIDHDHLTGLLCTHCNAWIDTCPHLTGCLWADYLNAPPAGRLSVRHPKPRAMRAADQARIEYLGIDPYQ